MSICHFLWFLSMWGMLLAALVIGMAGMVWKHGIIGEQLLPIIGLCILADCAIVFWVGWEVL